MGFFDTTPSACFIDDLLNFNIDETNSFSTNPKATLLPHSAPFTECEDEEELEWLSNEDVFPSLETFVPCVEPFANIMPFESSNTSTTLKHESPVSVLENSNSSYGSSNSNSNNSSAVITSCCSGRGLAPPIRRPRSKASRRRLRGGFVNVPSQQWFILCSRIESNKPRNYSVNASVTFGVTGRKCKHCGSEKTPQWRAGPDGPKTLCNACGVRYKSGRLCPEYRPANSPTFSCVLHSSSHRKIVEMRKMKQMPNMKINSVDSR